MKYIFSKFVLLKEEVQNNFPIYIILFFVLSVSFYLRIYRINDLLGFYYDQGRDALVIWELIYKGNTFLIGPTTGIAGIFRGPYYYYLIAPFYFLGKGNPVIPSIFLSFTTIVASLIGYYLGSKMFSRTAGLFFAIISSFSYYIFNSSRWLSNPTPMLLLSMLIVLGMYYVTVRDKRGWPLIAFTSGMSLFNFGSSGEFFYFPALLVFFIWQWKNRPDKKGLLLSIFLFTVSFVPLVIFDIRNNGLLRNNMYKSFVGEKSFGLVTQFLFDERNKFFKEIGSNLIFHGVGKLELIFLLVLAGIFIISFIKLIKNQGYRILLLLLLSVLGGLYFFRGNYGVLYDYYLTGYYLIFLLLISALLGFIWKYSLGKIFVFYFFALFLFNNLDVIRFRLSDQAVGSETIVFKNQKQAIEWIYSDAKGEDFNVDVYVPPVIPYAYDYLFKWYGGSAFGYEPVGQRIDPLYTLYEADPPHPERLQAWLDRQKGIGKIETESRFGGIVVQRRTRIKSVKY